MNSQTRLPLRWIAVGVFVLCSTVNFLDRQLLAAAAPSIKAELSLSNAQYGQILSAFAFAYTLVAPLFGWVVDRFGVSTGMNIAVGVWSIAGMATGFTRSFAGLLGCRALLGVGESAGMPGLAKANAMYLKPGEFAMSLAFNHVTLGLGATLAPLLMALIAPRYGWQSVFVACGAAGLLWIPLWGLTSRKIPPPAEPRRAAPAPFGSLVLDRRMWGLIFANASVMTVYTVWTNWTTIYLVQVHRLTAAQANQHFAWIPPVFATAGGFFGGWLAQRWIARGVEAVTTRMRAGWISALLLLVSAVLPAASSPMMAVCVIGGSLFSCMILQTNLHVLPIDLFGPGRAGFSVSALACSYGLVQMILSPLIGAAIDHAGFMFLSPALAVTPLLGMFVLAGSLRDREVPGVAAATRAWRLQGRNA